jgi:hypothetical protein
MMTLMLISAGVLAVAFFAAMPAGYQATPWQGRAQAIPGKVRTAFYDMGGEGAAYHNDDTKNHGSGELNQGPEPKHNFRKDEGISISFTKPEFDKFQDGTLLPVDEYYVGWTAPGETINYTVDVQAADTYQLNMLASSNNQNAEISFAVNGVDATGPLVIESTGHWHTWRMYNALATFKFEKGPQVLTLKFLKEGNMNVQYLEFVKKG